MNVIIASQIIVCCIALSPILALCWHLSNRQYQQALTKLIQEERKE